MSKVSLSDDRLAIPFELVAFHLCPKTCLIGDWHLSCTAGFQAWHTVTFIYTILLLSSPFLWLSQCCILLSPLLPEQHPGVKLYCWLVMAIFQGFSDISALRQLFEKFGPVNECHLPRNKQTGNSKGFAFVEFRQSIFADA